MQDYKDRGDTINEFEIVGHGVEEMGGILVGGNDDEYLMGDPKGCIRSSALTGDKEYALDTLINGTFSRHALITTTVCFDAEGPYSLARAFAAKFPNATVLAHRKKALMVPFSTRATFFAPDLVK